MNNKESNKESPSTIIRESFKNKIKNYLLTSTPSLEDLKEERIFTITPFMEVKILDELVDEIPEIYYGDFLQLLYEFHQESPLLEGEQLLKKLQKKSKWRTRRIIYRYKKKLRL